MGGRYLCHPSCLKGVRGPSDLFAAVLQEIEREDQAWEQSRKPKPRHGRNLETNEETTMDVEAADRKPEHTKSQSPPGFY